ncbi:hypothetical protein ACFVGN_08330 [Streptomyces sp. NPDC057757]|uniref:hypothetical protein n=1 Tax=Streptomyces sp. NPDC057757 TaxID=3346241 RepID=UPI00367AB3E1
MADERCVFPGDNPRPPGRWLDRDAAERLLRGEPLEAVDEDNRNQVERLTGALAALAALAAGPVPSGEELPGEAAALAAFRKVRADADGDLSTPGPRGRTHAVTRTSTAYSSDAGLVRLGPPGPGSRRVRWNRPTRLGLAAALAVGMIGGVAVVAGTGILPTPFGDDKPGPAASVTAAATPERPLGSPSPDAAGGAAPRAEAPDEPTSGPTGGGSARNEAGGSATDGRQGSDAAGDEGRTGQWWSRTRSSCRDVLAGKQLDAGRRHVLETAAGGPGQDRLKTYCDGVLDRRGTGDGFGDAGNDPKGGDTKGSGTDLRGESRSGRDEDPQPGAGGGDADGDHIPSLLPGDDADGRGGDGRDDDGRGGGDGRDEDRGAGRGDRGGRDNDALGDDGERLTSSPKSSTPGGLPSAAGATASDQNRENIV